MQFLEALAVANVPALQLVQECCPNLPLLLPGSHTAHALWPVALWYFAGGHREQLVDAKAPE